MADSYFLFFRCWCGFSEPFPFEQFNELSDESLGPALESYAREKLQQPNMRSIIRQKVKQRRDYFFRAMDKEFSSRHGRDIRLKRVFTSDLLHEYWRRVRHRGAGFGSERTDPLICRLGVILGWYIKRTHRMLWPQVWFWETPSKEFAVQLTSTLHNQRTLDYDTHQVDYELNPRFGIVEESSCTNGQKAVIRRCIRAINDGQEPAVPNAKAALSIGRKAFLVADELSRAWDWEDGTFQPDAPTPPSDKKKTRKRKVEPDAEAEQGEENGGAESTPTIPNLSERQYNILQAMLELGAVAVQDRTTTKNIAFRAEGEGISPEQFKRPMSDLKKRKLVDSQVGRDGGSWLTDRGRAVAEILKNKGDTKR